MSFEVLESVLRPLSYWYNQENIEEVAINREGQVWLRLRGKRAYPWVMYKDEKLTKEYLTDLLYIIAKAFSIKRRAAICNAARNFFVFILMPCLRSLEQSESCAQPCPG